MLQPEIFYFLKNPDGLRGENENYAPDPRNIRDFNLKSAFFLNNNQRLRKKLLRHLILTTKLEKSDIPVKS
jgi:hypothetical protein